MSSLVGSLDWLSKADTVIVDGVIIKNRSGKLPNWNVLDEEEVVRRFTNVKPRTEDNAQDMDELTAQFIEFGQFLVRRIPAPAGRELALAMTALEEVCFWTKKGYALNQP